MCFITWRTADSMPASVLQHWLAERDQFLASTVSKNSKILSWREMSELIQRWDSYLDECRGAGLLRRRDVAQIVAESLLKFDGDRYELTDFVVMPNHVHVLVAFHDETSMVRQCAGWKRFTARRINQLTGRQGVFWQTDSFDHLVRSVEYFEHYRRYIAENGPRAGLAEGEYRSYSKK